METSLADQYYLKALEAYPYELSAALESLTYALSYDDNHCQSYCLMGQVYMSHIKEYKKAEYYFNQAMSSDLQYPDTIKYFSLLKIWTCDFDGALKLIEFGLKIKGMNKGILLTHKALVYECRGQLDHCKQTLLLAENSSIEPQSGEYVKLHLNRVNAKIKRMKKASRKKVKKKVLNSEVHVTY